MSAKHKATGKGFRARAEKQEPDDFFPTYHSLTRALLDVVRFPRDSIYLEPCAGAGDITKVLLEKYPNADILQFDINPRKPDITKANFLTHPVGTCDYVVTNPPFTLFTQFLKRCMEWRPTSIHFLSPLDYLFGGERYDTFYSRHHNGYSLKVVRPFVCRPMFSAASRADGPIGNGMQSFCWMEFVRCETVGRPEIEWLDVRHASGTRWPVDQLRMDT